MDTTITWVDYVKYLFTSAKKDGMSAFWLSILKAVQYVAVGFLAIVCQQVFDSLNKGTFELFNWAAWQSYMLPGFIFVVGFLNEIFRKASNPAISTKFLSTVPPTAGSTSPPYQPNVAIRTVEPPEN